jgi:Holliday junction DNA helicase RuvA
MIASLRGQVAEKGTDSAIVEVNGVGYRVHLSVRTLTRLPEVGQTTQLRIQTVVREDAFELFGFGTRAEEDMFLLLTSVSHVGPRLATMVLSGLEVDELCHAIGKGEVARLTKLHGVGKKTAERLVLELKDKVKSIAVETSTASKSSLASGPRSDLVSALVNLGYKPAMAEKAAEAALETGGDEAPFEALFKEALKGLRSAV